MDSYDFWVKTSLILRVIESKYWLILLPTAIAILPIEVKTFKTKIDKY